MTYEQWDAYTTELQNKHGYKATSQGALAKVSLYEFVNDWLRPEISFKIFSYLGDPHKAGVWKSQRQRRVYTKTTKLIDGTIVRTKRKWRWVEAAGRNLPYSRLKLYNQIANYRSNYNDANTHDYNYPNDFVLHRHIAYWALPCNYLPQYDSETPWDARRDPEHAHLVGYGRQRLQHTNKLLQELWAATFHRSTHYLTTKEGLQELCKINKVKGRTNLFKPKKPHPVVRSHRQPIITALIKLE